MAFCVTFESVFTVASTASNAVGVPKQLPIFTVTTNPQNCSIVALTGAEYNAQNTAINTSTTTNNSQATSIAAIESLNATQSTAINNAILINTDQTTLLNTHTTQITELQNNTGSNVVPVQWTLLEAQQLVGIAALILGMAWILKTARNSLLGMS